MVSGCRYSLYGCFGLPWTMYAFFSPSIVDEYSGIYETVAEETGALLIETLNEGITDDRRYKSDMIHPNSAGYRKIADKIMEDLAPMLDEMDRISGQS